MVLRKPYDRVNIYGSKQNAEVKVIYEKVDDSEIEDSESEDEIKTEDGEKMPELHWNAVGLTGPRWTNFCMVNNIVPGHIMMFTNPTDGTYLVDVFTPQGVGFGVAALSRKYVGLIPTPNATRGYMSLVISNYQQSALIQILLQFVRT